MDHGLSGAFGIALAIVLADVIESLTIFTRCSASACSSHRGGLYVSEPPTVARVHHNGVGGMLTCSR
jgi:hypothetical protein